MLYGLVGRYLLDAAEADVSAFGGPEPGGSQIRFLPVLPTP